MGQAVLRLLSFRVVWTIVAEELLGMMLLKLSALNFTTLNPINNAVKDDKKKKKKKKDKKVKTKK
jgi:hypothetical protein